jgi:hypothetical protein
MGVAAGTKCSTARADPCGCNWITCGQGRITEVNLAASSLFGVLSPSWSNLTEMVRLQLWNNSLSGDLPAWAGMTKVVTMDLHQNFFHGQVPADFAAGSYCRLDMNEFECPLPQGMTAKCQATCCPAGMMTTRTGQGTPPVCFPPTPAPTPPPTPPFNNCTGASTKLDPTECKAWGELYVAMTGDGWNFCIGTKTDPCSCKDTCSSDGTTVVKMCVMRHCRCRSFSTLAPLASYRCRVDH